MGIVLTVGNAVLTDKWLPVLERNDPHWVVEDVHHENAPNFNVGDDRCNSRAPSSSVWSEFCREVGLYELFYNESEGLLRGDWPGVNPLQAAHLDKIQWALDKRRRTNGGAQPGFDEPNSRSNFRHAVDPQLARLVWLEYWVRWALTNCERPSLQFL
jgi:hypothetical protein